MSAIRSMDSTCIRGTPPRPTRPLSANTVRVRSIVSPMRTFPRVVGDNDCDARLTKGSVGMSAEDLEKYETEMELQLYREYRDVVGLFKYVLETERRFYLTNHVDRAVRSADGEMHFKLTMPDACATDIYL